jgi:hypothetical protein
VKNWLTNSPEGVVHQVQDMIASTLPPVRLNSQRHVCAATSAECRSRNMAVEMSGNASCPDRAISSVAISVP